MRQLATLTAALALTLGMPLPAHPTVFGFVDDGGGVHLGNVPVDPRYQVVVPEAVPAAGAASAPLPGKTMATARRKLQFDSIVEAAAKRHGLDDALLHAVITVESRYDAAAISRKGAIGLMQLMPATASRYGVTDPFDPAQNVSGGARYLRDLLRMFDQNLPLALAAFNAGEDSVVKHGWRIPPIRETREYVPRVLDLYRRYRPVS